jgi:uncharacterized membrane protein
MIARVHIRQHPVHPMLVTLPLGLWVFAIVCYAVYLLSGAGVWRTVALYSLGGGIVGAVSAAAAGLFDYLSLPKSKVQTTALSHMVVNVVALTIFTIALILAIVWEGHEVVPFLLLVVGGLVLGVGGWLGGALVYEHGVAVKPVEEVLKKPEGPTSEGSLPT